MAHPRQNGHRFLFHAIERGDKSTAQNLIRNGVGINNVQLNNSGLLHSAIIKFDDLDIMTMLLDKGANIHAKDHYNNKPLDIAIQNNKTEAASLLIRRGALVGENLDSWILMVIEKSNHTILEMLINHRMQNNPSSDLKILCNAAISRGNPNIIKHIIPHCQFSESSDKYIPRELVIKSDLQYKESIEILLKWNFTINPNSCNDEDFIGAALANGHLQIILQLLKFGTDVNMVNSNTGLNLLAIACSNKHHQLVESLIQHGADVNVMVPAKDWPINNELSFLPIICQFNRFLSLVNVEYYLCNITCLHIAVFNADPIMIEILLNNGTKIADDPEFFFITCLAAYINCEEIVRIFLNHGLRVRLIDLQGKALLYGCVYSNSGEKDSHYDVAKLLLNKGANIHLHTPGNTFVYDAMIHGHHRIAELFLYYEADVHYISPNSDTSLHKAIVNNFNVAFIKTLLKLKSPIDVINSKGLTPLLAACKIQSLNKFKIIEALLQYNANVNCTDIKLRTPLHSVCDARNLMRVIVLPAKVANPNAANVEGQTHPHRFTYKFNCSETLNIIQLLLKHNADVEAMDADGWTPLFIACYSRNETAVKCLLDNHAYVNHTDLQNLSPLHIAVEQESIEMTRNLIKCGANVNIVDENNQTALQIAIELDRVLQFISYDYRLNKMNNSKEIIKILKTQVIKLVVAKLKVNDQDQNVACNPNCSLINVPQLEAKCQQEIDMMKMEYIEYIGTAGTTDNVSFYDLLKKDVRFLRKFVDNEDIQKTLKLPLYDTKFPLYIDIVRGQFRDIKFRYEVMNSAREYFSKHVCQRMPDDCIYTVFSYLSIGELKIFIKGMKSLNGDWSVIELDKARIDSDHK